MKSKLLLTFICVLFGSNVRSVISQGLMQGMLGFAALNTPENIGPVQGFNDADLPPLDPFEPPFPPDTGHSSNVGPVADSQSPPVDLPSKGKTKPVDKLASLASKTSSNTPADPSTSIDTGLPSDPFPLNNGNVVDQFPGEPIDPNFQRDPIVADPSAGDPFGNDPFANDPFANDPFANDPFANDPGATGGDVPTIHQESPFFQFIPTSFKNNKQQADSPSDHGSGLPIQTDHGPGQPIQTDPIQNQAHISDTFKSNVKQVDTALPIEHGHQINVLSPVDSGIPTEPIPLGPGTPINTGLLTDPMPIDPMPIEQLHPDQGTLGSDVSSIHNEVPVFRFLPSMPQGESFLNLNDGTEITFQATDDWMGEPLGVAKFEPNALDPWDPVFPPGAQMTDVILDPAPGSKIADIPQDHGTPILPDFTPVDLNPLGPAENIVHGGGSFVGDPHFIPGNTIGDNNAIPLGPVIHSTKPIVPVDPHVKPLGPIHHNLIPLDPTDKHVTTHGRVDLKPIPKPVDKTPVKPVDNTVSPFGPVLERPKIDPNVIPLGPIFGTPVILNPVVDKSNQGQGRGRDQHGSQVTDTVQPNSQKIPDSWMQLYTKDRRRPVKKVPVQLEKTEAVQVSPTDNLLAQASLNTYSKNRGLTRRLRQERRRARKLRQLQRQKQKQLNRLQNKQQKQINKARKQKQKRQNRRGQNRTGPQGAKIAKMVLPGNNQPFVGKNQRGRYRRMVMPCTGERRRLGLCAQDQLPPDALNPSSPSNTNTRDGILVGVPDPTSLLVQDAVHLEPSSIFGPHMEPLPIVGPHMEPRPTVGPNSYMGRQPAGGGAIQHAGQGHGEAIDGMGNYVGRQPAVADNSHGGHLSSGDTWNIEFSYSIGQAATLREQQHMGVPLGSAMMDPNNHGGQQLIGIQTVNPQDVGPLRKLKRGGRRQQGNKFQRNGQQGNKRPRVNRRNMRNNRNMRKGNRLNRVNRRKQNQRNINRTGPGRRGPIMRVPNMQDVGASSLPVDTATGVHDVQGTWDPMTGVQVGLPIEPLQHGVDLSHDTQHALDPLGSGIRIPSDIVIQIPGKQLGNEIQHDSTFHHQTSTIQDANSPNKNPSSNIFDPHSSVQHGSHQGIDTHNLPKAGQRLNSIRNNRKRKNKLKGGANQTVVAPIHDNIPHNTDSSTLFDPHMTVNGVKNRRKNNRQRVNKKGRKKWKKGNKQNKRNKKKGPKIREPKKFKPVEIQSVVKQEQKPTTPDTSNMIRIAGLGFLDLGTPMR